MIPFRTARLIPKPFLRHLISEALGFDGAIGIIVSQTGLELLIKGSIEKISGSVKIQVVSVTMILLYNLLTSVSSSPHWKTTMPVPKVCKHKFNRYKHICYDREVDCIHFLILTNWRQPPEDNNTGTKGMQTQSHDRASEAIAASEAISKCGNIALCALLVCLQPAKCCP